MESSSHGTQASSTTIENMKDPSNFNRMPSCCGSLPTLSATENHTVLFTPNIVPGKAPNAYPDNFEDKWDDDHVRMPCSSHNVIAIKDENGKKQETKAWEIINTCFSKPITSIKELSDAVSTYSEPYGHKENLGYLEFVLQKEFSKEETNEFFKCTLPKIIELALSLPKICTQAIPLLKTGKPHSITISQKQISCILANAFLATFPEWTKSAYNSVRFSLLSSKGLFSHPLRSHRAVEKVKCILNYFRRVTQEEPTGTVTFQRKCLTRPPVWSSSENNLSGLWMRENGTIENEGADMLQVDFADEYVGGLVLRNECAQEEILFILSPELIAAMFFTEKLADNETLLVTGCERYNIYSGYEHSFRWKGDYHDETPRDSWGRKYIQMIAMDALASPGLNEFRKSSIERELNKAFCGFDEQDTPSDNLPAIASGKWGCGVFNGTPQLKSLIQLMAASQARRDLVLYTFNDAELKRDVESLYHLLIKKNITVGKLWNLLARYYENVVLKYDGSAIMLLYEFLYDELQH